MSSGSQDWELQAAGDPRTHPQLLSDIATRRPDLRAIIAANPSAFAELRSWIAAVGNDAPRPQWTQQFSQQQMQQQQVPSQALASQQAVAPGAFGPAPAAHFPPPRPRRSGVGWWFAGCGCLTLLMLVLFGGLLAGGALLSAGGGGSASRTGRDSANTPDEQYIDEQMSIAASERQTFHELAAQLEGNPVGPLVTEFTKSQRLDRRIAEGAINRFQAEDLAQEAVEMREALEQRIADAAERRGNASGTISEALVDEAGADFIDIAWDAATECATSDKESVRTAGCTSVDPLGVHILPENELFGEWGVRLTTLHELAHLYQNADGEASEWTDSSATSGLKARGYFEGNGEKLADCYALTYTGGWTLENEQGSIGYGYVCNESERQAIREWAAHIHAPMP